MRRDASRERIFYLLVSTGALLLLSALMLRHDRTKLTTRKFRDGFTVAEDVVRRTEIVAPTDKTALEKLFLANLLHNEESDRRTTTIKTENGDEIIIKRAATSKGDKITTISRDERGKLTIEDASAEKAKQAQAKLKSEGELALEKKDRITQITGNLIGQLNATILRIQV